MSFLLPDTPKIQLSKLPYAFRKRLTTLAPTQIVNNLSKLCKNKKIKAYDHVFITDDLKVFRWASEDTFPFRVFKFLHQFAILRYFLDGSDVTNPMWEAVVHMRDIRRSKQSIYADETLVLYFNSPNTYDYVIPYIRGLYTRLILHGNIRWDQVLQLIHPGVKRVRIIASVTIPTQQYGHFAEFIASQFHDFNSSFVMFFTPTLTLQLRTKLREVCERHNLSYEAIGGSKQRISIGNWYNEPCYFGILFFLAFCNSLVTLYKINSLGVIYAKSYFLIISMLLWIMSGVLPLFMILYVAFCPPTTDEIEVNKEL